MREDPFIPKGEEMKDAGSEENATSEPKEQVNQTVEVKPQAQASQPVSQVVNQPVGQPTNQVVQPTVNPAAEATIHVQNVNNNPIPPTSTSTTAPVSNGMEVMEM